MNVAFVSDLDRLMAFEDIKALKARYSRAVDTKAWGLLDTVFTEESISGPNERGDVTTGLAAIKARLQGALNLVQTMHQCYNPELELTSATTATGIWSQEDRLWDFPPGTGGTMHGYGHYHDTYAKTADGWRVASSKLVRIRVDIDAAE